MFWLEIPPFFGTSETHQWQPGRVEVTKVDVTSGQGQVAPIFTNTFPISIKIYEVLQKFWNMNMPDPDPPNAICLKHLLKYFLC